MTETIGKYKHAHIRIPTQLWANFISFVPMSDSPTKKIEKIIMEWIFEQMRVREDEDTSKGQ